MPRYYFNMVLPDKGVVPDDEGIELQDDTVARREALQSIRDLVAEALLGNPTPIHVTVEIVKDGVGVIDRLTGQLAIEPMQKH